MNSRLCKIYRSPRQKLTYLYVDFSRDLDAVPDELLSDFGEPQLVMSVTLEPQRMLALVEASTVLSQIEQCGYYLQLPPPPGHAVSEWLRAERAAD